MSYYISDESFTVSDCSKILKSHLVFERGRNKDLAGPRHQTFFNNFKIIMLIIFETLQQLLNIFGNFELLGF